MSLLTQNSRRSMIRPVGVARSAKGSRWRRSVFALATLGLAAAARLAGAEGTAVEARVDAIRIARHGEATRVVIDLSAPVNFSHIALAEPPRLAIDLPEVAWAVPRDEGGGAVGLIKGFRFGRPRPGVSRIVLDVAEPFEIDRVFELPPNGERGHRIITDLRRAPSQDWTAHHTNGAVVPAAGPAAPEAAALVIGRPPEPKPKPPSARQVVVLDPGHGGVDPGAIGSRTGILEKDVALRMGLALRDRLAATGRYEVIMTRADDRILRLRDRLEVARRSAGELFLSLHADSLKQAPRVRGASVYTLSERASNIEAARLARKENRADILAGIDLSEQEEIVTEILIDLAQRDANNKSLTVAELLVEELRNETDMAKRARAQAGFVVLKSPDMPSVLIELGYLSNPTDEAALADPAHIDRLAAAVARAIDRHFGYAPS
jgi:N-acetylmuramoyl-L-alanine amidase